MAVPADYGTPKRLITMAYRDAGKLARDVDPDSEMLLDGMNRLADILYHQQTKGLTLWLLGDTAVPLIAGISLYTFGPSGTTVMLKPFRVEYGYATDETPEENRRELTPLAYADWCRLSNDTQTGQVTQYFVDKQLTDMKVHLWLVPDAVQVMGSVHLIMRTKAAHLTNLYETMTFAPEWYLALRWALADDLATGQPLEVQNRCKSKANQYLEDLEGWDVEDVSVLFQPDQGQTYGGRFR